MTLLSKAVIALGVIILLIGAFQVVSYQDASNRADTAQGFDGISIFLDWLKTSYKLQIFNVFLTGFAIVLSGYTLHRVETSSN